MLPGCGSIRATDGASTPQRTSRLTRTPYLLVTTAESAARSPGSNTSREMVTLMCAGFGSPTVTSIESCAPPAVAVIVAVPVATAVSSPVAPSTVTTDGSLLLQWRSVPGAA